MKKDVKLMVYSAMLTALAIVIPTVFTMFRIIIGPFTATITAHVPMFLSMFLGPIPAIVVGIGSFLGFIFTGLPVVVALRALMHSIVGACGAYLLLKRKFKFMQVVFLTSILHGLLEAIVVIPFNFTFYQALIAVGIGSVLHHIVDGTISFVIVKSLEKSSNLEQFANIK